jgi:hypothetical protein
MRHMIVATAAVLGLASAGSLAVHEAPSSHVQLAASGQPVPDTSRASVSQMADSAVMNGRHAAIQLAASGKPNPETDAHSEV